MRLHYDKYIDWLQNTESLDALRGTVNNWTFKGRLWAVIQNVSGSRANEDGASRNFTYATIFIHNQPAVSPNDLLRYNGQVFRIDSMYYDGDEDELVADCISIKMLESEFVEDEPGSV